VKIPAPPCTPIKHIYLAIHIPVLHKLLKTNKKKLLECE
jgi:hypothetical protein